MSISTATSIPPLVPSLPDPDHPSPFSPPLRADRSRLTISVFAADPELHQLEAEYNADDTDAGAHEPLLNGRPTASMELSEIERELALNVGNDGHGGGGGQGSKGTLMEGIANVSAVFWMWVGKLGKGLLGELGSVRLG